MQKLVVRQSFVGLLYEDGRFLRELEPGKHRLGRWFFDRVEREVVEVDLRERSLTIKGQEILTADKVAIRVSLLVYFRVTQAQAAIHNVAAYEDRIYEDVQLAARRFLASRALDAILTDRNEISEAVREEVREAAASYGVEIVRADVKDLVFPGNLREIMNQVLETERRTEAHLIEARREADAMRIRTAAESEAQLQRIEAERERARIESESMRERLSQSLAAQVEEAEALREHPGLLELRHLDTLREMASSGARFVVGLNGTALREALKQTD